MWIARSARLPSRRRYKFDRRDRSETREGGELRACNLERYITTKVPLTRKFNSQSLLIPHTQARDTHQYCSSGEDDVYCLRVYRVYVYNHPSSSFGLTVSVAAVIQIHPASHYVVLPNQLPHAFDLEDSLV